MKKRFLKKMKIATDELSSKNNNVINEKQIIEIFEAYIYLYLGGQSSKNLLNKIKNKIPYKYKRIIKTFLTRTFANKKLNYKTLTDEVNSLEKDGVLINYKELNQIISVLKYSVNGN